MFDVSPIVNRSPNSTRERATNAGDVVKRLTAPADKLGVAVRMFQKMSEHTVR